jgi:hypothetical protein
LPKNTQIDIHHKGRVAMQRSVMMFGGEHQLNYRRRFPNSGAGHELPGEFSALFLVVSRARIVDRIVEPNGKLDRARFIRQVSHRIEFIKAIRNVLTIMIVPLRFRIESHESLIPSCSIMRRAPAQTIPSFFIESDHW